MKIQYFREYYKINTIELNEHAEKEEVQARYEFQIQALNSRL